MITEDYVSFEIAKLLKKKGFDADITTYRDDFIQRGNVVIPLQECLSKDRIKTPTLQMAMKWLREECDCPVEILWHWDADNQCQKWSFRHHMELKPLPQVQCFEGYETYEDAEKAAIKYCLENLI